MPLRTSLTGSYPPKLPPVKRFHLMPAAQQDPFVQDSIRRAIQDQADLGLDVFVDGQARGDIVSLFARHMPGFDPRSLAPTVIGKIRPAAEPLSVADYQYAQALCPGKPLKAHLTGPLTMSRGIYLAPEAPYTGLDDRRLLDDLTAALADEACALVAAGAEIVQIDEPVLQDGFDLPLAFSLIKRMISQANIPFPALHACGNITLILDEILHNAPVHMVSIESSWLDQPQLRRINEAALKLTGKVIGLGCFSSIEATVIPPDRLKRKLDFYVQRLGREQIWAVMPNCGLRYTEYELARHKLESLTQAARQL